MCNVFLKTKISYTQIQFPLRLSAQSNEKTRTIMCQQKIIKIILQHHELFIPLQTKRRKTI